MAPAFFQSGGKSKRSIISNNTNFDYFKVLFQRYLYEEMKSYYTLMTLSLPWWICSNHLGNHLNDLLGPQEDFKAFSPKLAYAYLLPGSLPGKRHAWGLRHPRTKSKFKDQLSQNTLTHSWRGREASAEVGRWERKQSRCWWSQAARAAFSTPYIKSNWWDSAWQSVWVDSGLSL